MSPGWVVPPVAAAVVGLSASVSLFDRLEEALAAAPSVGALALAALAPVLRLYPPAILPAALAAVTLALGPARRRGRRSPRVDPGFLAALAPHAAVTAVYLAARPMTASWVNPDELYHFQSSLRFASGGGVDAGYPFLVHLVGASCASLVPGVWWILSYRAILAALAASQGALIYLIGRELWGRRVGLLSSWSLLPMSSGLYHLFRVGTYANAMSDTLTALCALLLVRRRFIAAAALGATLPVAHTSTLYFLAFLAVPAVSKRRVGLAAPLLSAALVCGGLHFPAIRLSGYARRGTVEAFPGLRGLARALVSLLHGPIPRLLSWWSALSLGGMTQVRGWGPAGWLVGYSAGLVIASYLSFSGIAFAGQSWRFVLQLALPFSLLAGLSLTRLTPSLGPRAEAVLLAVILAASLAYSYARLPEHDDQIEIWSDMEGFCASRWNERGITAVGGVRARYLTVAGCEIASRISKPKGAELAESDRPIVVTRESPEEYRLPPPCFELVAETYSLLIYRATGERPPEIRSVEADRYKLAISIAAVDPTLSDYVLEPSYWKVFVNGFPVRVSEVNTAAVQEETAEGAVRLQVLLVLDKEDLNRLPAYSGVNVEVYGPCNSYYQEILSLGG